MKVFALASLLLENDIGFCVVSNKRINLTTSTKDEIEALIRVYKDVINILSLFKDDYSFQLTPAEKYTSVTKHLLKHKHYLDAAQDFLNQTILYEKDNVTREINLGNHHFMVRLSSIQRQVKQLANNTEERRMDDNIGDVFDFLESLIRTNKILQSYV